MCPGNHWKKYLSYSNKFSLIQLLSFTMAVTRIISIVLYQVLINFMITDEVFVKLICNFFGNSEIKKNNV